MFGITEGAVMESVAPPDIMLKISGLNVYYGESHILRDVDLSVTPGQMVCLIGRNGVGKTTLLKSIMGLLKPKSGEIYFQGQPITKLATDKRARLGIGYVPQGREVIPRVTVKENLLLGLEALAQRPKGKPSGGQQQQLAIARALMGKPQLLVLDEPTEGIQPSIILEIEAAVRGIIQRTGISVLLVEQHLHFVRQADRYYAMQKGGIVASGATQDLSQEVIQRFLAV